MVDWFHPNPLVELTAIVAGAVAGALQGVRKGFDVIGTVVLAIAAALGGGLVRDVLLARGTPVALAQPRYLLAALGAAVLCLLFAPQLLRLRRLFDAVDALALGLWLLAGLQPAEQAGLHPVAVVFVGVVSAVGGGIARDVLSGETPKLMVPGELTAIPALLGGSLYVLLAHAFPRPLPGAALAALAASSTLRLLAHLRQWRSPMPGDLLGWFARGWRRVRGSR